MQPRPIDKVFHYQGPRPNVSTLPLWNGTINYQGSVYAFTMVGTDPSQTNVSTTVPVDIIPIKIVIGTTTTHTFTPTHKLPNGKTVTQNIIASPIFNSGLDFNQGGTNVGQTQYVDAFQRANFWGSVSTNTGYHVLLGGPTVLPLQTIHASGSNGATATAFGAKVGLVNINYFDPKIQALITSLGIPPGTFPIFATYNVYLTNGSANLANCCIGGYHSFTGTSTYSHSTYVGTTGAFAQDVSAWSHEIGEWVDDPLTTSNSPCGILEVGDPLENEPNFGAYPYTLNGFTYHLQDLAMMPYFGDPPATSVNGWSTFQGTALSVCQNGA